MRLVLENNEGKAVRTFVVEGDQGVVISRKDTRRLEVHASVARLEQNRIKFDRLGEITEEGLKTSPFAVAQGGHLKLVDGAVGEVIKNETTEDESSRLWYLILALMVLFNVAFIGFLYTRPTETAQMEQELKQQVVQIVKKIPVKQQQPVVVKNAVRDQVVETQTVKTTTKTASIKRMGALAAFGSLSNGKQKGGINLGAVNTTAGPSLGGTQGSGGVQTTLYGKGLVAAPLGAGANMQGGGGYGTKGKGGGQAGYGKLSLVGSAGANTIPLGREALIEGGLDRDLIDDVIRKNMGQVRFCYEQGLQGDPALGGRVAVDFTIGSNGQVKIAAVQNTTLNSKLVEDCIVMRLKSWKFPLPEGGVDVKVSYPFVLRRAGQG